MLGITASRKTDLNWERTHAYAYPGKVSSSGARLVANFGDSTTADTTVAEWLLGRAYPAGHG